MMEQDIREELKATREHAQRLKKENDELRERVRVLELAIPRHRDPVLFRDQALPQSPPPSQL